MAYNGCPCHSSERSERRGNVTRTLHLRWYNCTNGSTRVNTQTRNRTAHAQDKQPMMQHLRGLQNLHVAVDRGNDHTNTTTGLSNGSNEAEASSSSLDGHNDRLGLIIFLVSALFIILLVVGIFAREYYYRKHGVDLCRGHSCHQRRRRRQRQGNEDNDDANGEIDGPAEPRRSSEQYDADRAIALELQRQLNEEEREAERIAKRVERRKWYEFYLKERSMVSTTSRMHLSQMFLFLLQHKRLLIHFYLLHYALCPPEGS